STVKMAGSMSTASKAMGAVNKQMDPQAIQKTLQDFEKESMKMDMSEELMEETLDSVFDDSDDEQEQDAIVNQVLDEIGIEVKSKLPQAPRGAASLSATKAKDEDDELKDLLEKIRS
ncbi:Snf7 family protein, partial [Salmonella sp. s51933]|uniref:Snf7 family protein n=1 Tax=Salmonella sp. s51933 TaxID=3160127 RepID=UPI003754FF7E